MGLWAAIRNWWKNQPRWPALDPELAALFNPSRLTVERALAIPAVLRAVSLLSADVAKLPIDLYGIGTGGTRYRIFERDAPVVKLLKRAPNSAMSAFTFRRTLTAHALLCGSGLAWIQRRGRRVVGLAVLDPTTTEPVDQPDGTLAWKITRIGESGIVQDTIPDRDVLHICGLSWDGRRGLSLLSVAAEALNLERQQLLHAAGLFERGLLLSGFLLSPKPLPDEKRAEIRNAIRQLYTGGDKAWDVGVLSGGLEWKPNVLEPSKAQLVESREFGVRQVAAIFGIPPHKLGDPSRTSYASLEQENADYLATGLDPWLTSWERELNRKLLSEDEQDRGWYWEHNRNALLRTAYGERVQGYAKLVEIGVMSPNEVRRRENMPARRGGDVYYTPANWLPAVTREEGEENGRSGNGYSDRASQVASHYALEGACPD